MALQREHLAVLIVIAVAVPVQFYLHNNFGNNQAQQRSQTASRFYKYLVSWRQWYDEMEEWIDEVLPPAAGDYVGLFGEDDMEAGEEGQNPVQIALSGANGITNVTDLGWFASSLKPRRVRQEELLYKVGDVVRYVDFKLTGVVVGWDKVLKAPEEWIKIVYGKWSDSYIDHPHYLMVCDTREVESAEEEIQYVAQNEIEIVEDVEEYDHEKDGTKTFTKKRIISHHLDQGRESSHQIMLEFSVHMFFAGFSERTGTYIMRPWLRRIYPKDY